MGIRCRGTQEKKLNHQTIDLSKMRKQKSSIWLFFRSISLAFFFSGNITGQSMQQVIPFDVEDIEGILKEKPQIEGERNFEPKHFHEAILGKERNF